MPAKEASTKKDAEDDLNPNQYYELRCKSIKQMKEKFAETKDPQHNPYPHKFLVDIGLTNFIKKYKKLKDEETSNDLVRVAGYFVDKIQEEFTTKELADRN